MGEMADYYVDQMTSGKMSVGSYKPNKSSNKTENDHKDSPPIRKSGETMDAKTIMEALQAPFPSQDIEWRVGSTSGDKSKGLALGYVTNRAIQNRLDEVFGPFGWQNQFREWKGNSQLCGISILWNDQWITKWDGSDDSNQEATKGGLSDSMKRAAYQWGVGRYLYKLPQQWVEIEPRGKSFVIKRGHEPKLPDWALPEGERNHKPQKPASIKNKLETKWEALAGTKDGFSAWYQKQADQGVSEQHMETFLTAKLLEKNKEKQGA